MKKEKMAFWCPADVSQRIGEFIQKGIYRDRSKAIVGLLRQALRSRGTLPEPLQHRVNQLAIQLERKPEVIVSQCVEGVVEMIDATEPMWPLIVREFRLREKLNKRP